MLLEVEESSTRWLLEVTESSHRLRARNGAGHWSTPLHHGSSKALTGSDRRGRRQTSMLQTKILEKTQIKAVGWIEVLRSGSDNKVGTVMTDMFRF